MLQKYIERNERKRQREKLVQRTMIYRKYS